MKEQSPQRKGPSSPDAEKAWQVRSKFMSMSIVFFDIMRSHPKEFIPQV
jgi:hypothetical protein